jgi:hypothetical protein
MGCVMRELRVIAVDWSGAKIRGGAKNIALAEARDGLLLHVERRLTREDVVERLIASASQGDVIAGLDFGFSLPAWYLRKDGFARAQDYWRWLAHGECADDLLRDCADPFWGRKGRTRPALEDHFRVTDSSVLTEGGRPKSVFQIAGAGAVGTGSIRGMPWLHHLTEAGFSVWPFDDPAFPLVLEIYPRTFYERAFMKERVFVKSKKDHRTSCIEQHPGVPVDLKMRAAETEDTFDAAVSAIAMSRHVAELRALPQVEDPVLRLEGIIWWPGWRAAHPRT